MTLNKRKLTILIIIAGIIVAALLFFVFHGGKGKNPSALYALPEDAIAFYKGKDFIKSYEQIRVSALWKELLSNENIHKIDQQVFMFDSLSKTNNQVKRLCREGEIIISLHKTAFNRVDVLALIQGKKKITNEIISKLIIPKSESRLIVTTFEGFEIYDYQLSGSESQVAFSIFDGIVAVSKNPLLVEDAIRTYKKNILVGQGAFFKIQSANDEENWNFNFRQLTSVVNLFVKPEHQDLLSETVSFAGTGNYGLSVENENFIFRGELMDIDSGRSFIDQFSAQKPVKNEIEKILPLQTSLYFSINLSDLVSFYEKYQKRLESEGKSASYTNEKKNWETKNRLNLEALLIPELTGQATLVVSEPIGDNLKNSVSAALKVKSTEKALAMFADLKKTSEMNDSGQMEYNGYKIYVNRIPGSSKLIFGNLFSNLEDKFVTAIRDYLILGSDLKALQRYIDDYTGKKTLGNSPEYASLMKSISSESNFTFYLNPLRSLNIPLLYLNDSVAAKFENNVPWFKKVSEFVFQVANNNNSYYSELIFSHSQNIKLNQETIWETEIDTSFSTIPFVVKNHNDNSWEILVFDNKNNLYLISQDGKIEWKKSFPAPLKGDIFLVDFFDNQKYQYLFTTSTHLQLVDRLGRNVANYPIRLSSEAKTGLSVYDQKEASDVKYFVGCANDGIYGYTLSGKPLAGWNPKSLNSPLLYPVYCLNINSKPVLVAVSTAGSIYGIDSKGSDIFPAIKIPVSFYSKPVIAAAEQGNLLSVPDTTGNLFTVNVKGNAMMKKFIDWGNPYFLDQFDFDQNGTSDFIFSWENTIAVYSTDGRPVSNLTLENPMTSKPDFVVISGKTFIVYRNEAYSKLFVTDNAGKIYGNFPVSCTSPVRIFDVNKDGSPEIIGGFENKVFLERL